METVVPIEESKETILISESERINILEENQTTIIDVLADSLGVVL